MSLFISACALLVSFFAFFRGWVEAFRSRRNSVAMLNVQHLEELAKAKIVVDRAVDSMEFYISQNPHLSENYSELAEVLKKAKHEVAEVTGSVNSRLENLFPSWNGQVKLFLYLSRIEYKTVKDMASYKPMMVQVKEIDKLFSFE